MANDEAEFGTELRGYRREDVDRALNDLRRELIKSNNDRADAAKEIRLLQARVSELQGELDEAGTPTYSGLGTRLESTLRVAEEQSTRLISQADIDAQRLRASSRAEADRTLREAQDEARDTLEDARTRSTNELTRARAESADTVERARAEAGLLTQ
ncbi:DivIVA domain-containing protein, partial [Curtobacterium sp. CT11-45]|uniref:DivIVA domain-containing protein n=2 Tax=unclassified Curtobacterium TaxID=257496 RepID=UPI0039AEB1CB